MEKVVRMKKRKISQISVNIPVMFFEENHKVIAFTPVLDLSTTGKNMEDAAKNFEEALAIFIEECDSHGTLEDCLRSYGWVTGQSQDSGLVPPRMIGNKNLAIQMPAFA